MPPLSKKLRKCFVCFQPTKKFGKTDDKFLSVVMWLRLKGHLPYPPEGSPVLIKDWDPCEPCVPKTLDLYKEYAKMQDKMKEQRGVVKGGEKMVDADADNDIASTGSDSDDNSEDDERDLAELKHILYGDYLTPDEDEQLEALRKKKKKKTKERTAKIFKCRKCPALFTQQCKMARHIVDFHENDGRLEESAPADNDSDNTKGGQDIDIPLQLQPEGEEGEIPQKNVVSKGPSPLQSDTLLISIPIIESAHPADSDSTSTKGSQDVEIPLHPEGEDGEIPQKNVVTKGPSFLQSDTLPISIPIPITVDRNESYQCPQCPTLVKTNDDLQSHIGVVHNQEVVQVFKCPQCPVVVKTDYQLQCHLTAVHHVDVDRVFFRCWQCPSLFMTYDDLQRHIKAHEESRAFKFKCPQCSRSFTRRSQLIDHEGIVHAIVHEGRVHAIICDGRVRYKCPRAKCNRTFSSKQAVGLHVAAKHEKIRRGTSSRLKDVRASS